MPVNCGEPMDKPGYGDITPYYGLGNPQLGITLASVYDFVKRTLAANSSYNLLKI